jgi:erythromycin esterase-like protein
LLFNVSHLLSLNRLFVLISFPMKFLFFLFFFFTVQNLFSQLNGVTNFENTDVREMMKQIDFSNTSTVLLGEQRHGEGTTLKINVEIIKILHEQYGFSHLLIESDAWSLLESANKNVGIDDYRKSIHKIWSDTEEFYSLLQYVNDHQMKIYGFDSRLHGELSKKDVAGFVSGNIPQLLLENINKDHFLNTIKSCLNFEFKDTTQSAQVSSCINVLDKWRGKIDPENTETIFKIRLVRNYLNQVLVEKTSSDEYVTLREQYMVENAKYLIENNLRNEKVIVFGASLHTQPGVCSLSGHSKKNVGDMVKELPGNSIGIFTVAGSGTYYSGNQKMSKVEKPAKGTLFYQLVKEKTKAALINLEKYDNKDFYIFDKNMKPGIFGEYLIFIDKTEPVTLLK